jgi:DeoR/GlpR family transcriptional regulator of sugar metabolism
MKRNLSATRINRILDWLAAHGEVSAAELAEHFHVTGMTIRRDLELLASQGRIIRTHGGALLAAPTMVAFEFQSRQQSRLPAKQAIARAAARLVEPGMTVVLDTGTTTLELARLLGGVPRLTVLTSSLAIASALLAHKGLELILLGGSVNKESPDLSGPLTLGNLAAFRAHLAFVGADAADERGFYTSGLQIAQVTRAMCENAERAILLADSSKFGAHATVRIAGWDLLDGLIVDADLPAQARGWARRRVKSCALVPVEKEEPR